MIPLRPSPPWSPGHGNKPDVLRFHSSRQPASPGLSGRPAGNDKQGTLPEDHSSTPTMDVFLIPTTSPDQYEIYYEAPDTEDPVGEPVGRGIVQRVRHRFSEMLREAEEWRHKRHEDKEAPPAGLIARGRRRVMGFVVERIAEQRLLWHLRKATCVCAQIPTDMSEDPADAVIRAILKKDLDHHFRWIWIDLGLLILTAPLFVIPGPNVPGFYFTFQVVGHFLSYRGARQGLSAVRWTIRQNSALTELRSLLVDSAPHRMRRVHELAARLRLQHLATYFEQVAS